ncbi:hypothetical protein [Zhihengliuella sp.]|uniref:alpha/beta hydrolase family protein n=1 Tax=Zhihengliuella sp. TaxID=1954483 RepID=UPI0028113DD7|nr:hypothetical protein [Zhihengliuella sp.]
MTTLPDPTTPPDRTGDPSRGRGAEPLLARLALNDGERDNRIGPSEDVSPVRTAGAYFAALLAPFERFLLPAGAGAPAPLLLEEAEGPGYVRQRWQLELYAGMPLGVYVLRPSGPGAAARGEQDTDADAARVLGSGVPSARPTVLAIHGHGYGSRQLVGLKADGTVDTDRTDGHAHFGETLARLGANVVVPDILGFGPRRSAADLEPAENSACASLTSHLSALGLSLAGARAAELIGVLDSLPALGLDASARLGVAGHSGGSLLAVVTALANRRISAVALSGYVNTFAQSILAMRHCPCNYLPGLLRVGEMPDLLAALAPRHLLVEGGTADPIFPIAGFRTAVVQLREAYAAAGAAGSFLAVEHDGDHRVDGGTIHPALVATLTRGSVGCT